MKPVPPVTNARNATTGHRVFRITTCRRSTPSTREILRCVRGFRPMMQFARVVDVYEKIEATTKRLEMTELLVGLLRETPKEDLDKVVYLTQGRIHPDYAGIELGLAEKMVIRVLAHATGLDDARVRSEERRVGKEWG